MIVPLSCCCIHCKRHAFTSASVTRPGDNNQVEWVELGSYLKPSHIVYIDVVHKIDKVSKRRNIMRLVTVVDNYSYTHRNM